MSCEYSNILIAVIVIVGMLSVCTAYYSDDILDDAVAKRNYQRRSFLKSFCARRCLVGRGGNVCRCNGFHFAGKRTSDSADFEAPRSSDALYSILQEGSPRTTADGSPVQALQEAGPLGELPDDIHDIEELLPVILQQSFTQSNLEAAERLFQKMRQLQRNKDLEGRK